MDLFRNWSLSSIPVLTRPLQCSTHCSKGGGSCNNKRDCSFTKVCWEILAFTFFFFFLEFPEHDYDVWSPGFGCCFPCHSLPLWHGLPGTQHLGVGALHWVLAAKNASCHAALLTAVGIPVQEIPQGKLPCCSSPSMDVLFLSYLLDKIIFGAALFLTVELLQGESYENKLWYFYSAPEPLV